MSCMSSAYHHPMPTLSSLRCLSLPTSHLDLPLQKWWICGKRSKGLSQLIQNTCQEEAATTKLPIKTSMNGCTTKAGMSMQMILHRDLHQHHLKKQLITLTLCSYTSSNAHRAVWVIKSSLRLYLFAWKTRATPRC